MSQTITISDDLYARLDQSARDRGLDSIQNLIEVWQIAEEERERPRDAVQLIDAIYQRMFEAHSEKAEGAHWIRQDQPA
jgi:hypothetical protein